MMYRLRRFGRVDLEFNGDLLGEDSSHEDDKKRWTEIRIYSTDTDKWVTEVQGRTTYTDEADRYRAVVCDTPDQVVTSLRQFSRKTKRWYLTNTALNALDEAVEKDPRLAVAVREKV